MTLRLVLFVVALARAVDPWTVLRGFPPLRHVEDEKPWLPRVTLRGLRAAFSGGDARLQAFMRQLEAGAPVTVVAVGGSVTAGVMCTEGKRALQACCWSRRVFDWISEAANGTATYRNVARAGTTSTGFLPAAAHVVRQVLADAASSAGERVLLFVDFSVNDSFEYGKYHEDHHGYARLKGTGLIAERLVQEILAAAPRVAVVPLVMPCPACETTASTYGKVYKHYALPSVPRR